MLIFSLYIKGPNIAMNGKHCQVRENKVKQDKTKTIILLTKDRYSA